MINELNKCKRTTTTSCLIIEQDGKSLLVQQEGEESAVVSFLCTQLAEGNQLLAKVTNSAEL